MDKHLVSQEADRRAYQTARNIIRLSDYRKQRTELETLKTQLASAMIVKYSFTTTTVEQLEQAIKHGFEALNNGYGIQRAIDTADQHLQELTQ